LLRVLAPSRALDYARFWVRLVLWGARAICNIRVQVTGREHLPREGAALLASQHQSAFDTLVWLTLVPLPSYILKRELTRIPLFGPMLLAAGNIAVDRSAGAAALRGVLAATAQARDTGRQILIFPEGTRVAPGTRVALQPGIAAIAARLAMSVIPVATDSGLHWGRRAFTKYPGVIHIAIGPSIAAGTPRPALLAAIEAHWRACEAAGFEPVDKSVGNVPAGLPGKLN
jgi:1-acyl-sn-glycerol-3-phosphate acyltransferase